MFMFYQELIKTAITAMSQWQSQKFLKKTIPLDHAFLLFFLCLFSGLLYLLVVFGSLHVVPLLAVSCLSLLSYLHLKTQLKMNEISTQSVGSTDK